MDGKTSTARKIVVGTGLTGGGDLTQDRTLAVDFGTTAGKAAQGNDARLSDKRAPVDGRVQTISLADSAVTAVKTATAVQASLGRADTAVQGDGLTLVTSSTDPGGGTPATTITLVI